ncbi:hypothetical protein [Segatella buccae]|uniref:hypothetical protein n=1 Tax=Segatella buccae TaxID=28126 RepID=UPI003FD88EF2
MITVIDFNDIARFCHVLMAFSLFSGRFMWAKISKLFNTRPYFLILRPFFLRNRLPKPQDTEHGGTLTGTNEKKPYPSFSELDMAFHLSLKRPGQVSIYKPIPKKQEIESPRLLCFFYAYRTNS